MRAARRPRAGLRLRQRRSLARVSLRTRPAGSTSTVRPSIVRKTSGRQLQPAPRRIAHQPMRCETASSGFSLSRRGFELLALFGRLGEPIGAVARQPSRRDDALCACASMMRASMFHPFFDPPFSLSVQRLRSSALQTALQRGPVPCRSSGNLEFQFILSGLSLNTVAYDHRVAVTTSGCWAWFLQHFESLWGNPSLKHAFAAFFLNFVR
jgi:hypothetical protein